MHLLPLILASAAAFVNAAPAAAPRPAYTLHQKRDVQSSQWLKRSEVQADAQFPMRIGLTQGNLDNGHKWVMDVSDPKSANYGKHWSQQDVVDAFAPSDDSVRNVADWLMANGVDKSSIKQSKNKGWIQFDTTADQAGSLFATKFYEHEHATKSGRLAVACDEYSVPSHLTEHIDYITPGVVPAKLKRTAITKRDAPKPKFQNPPRMPYWNDNPLPPYLGIPADLVNCSKWITPACVRALYDIPLPWADADPSNFLGIFEEEDTYAQEDLDAFFTTFFPTIPNGTHPTLYAVDGAVAPVPVAQAGGESDLDFTLAYPIVYPQEIVLYQTDDPIYAAEALNGTLDGFLDTFLDALDGSFCSYSAYGQTGDNSTLDPTYPDPNPGGYKGTEQCGVYTLANVLSVSYGGAESGLPVNYQKRQCDEFMKLALQGHTILFASGDYGVASFPNPPEYPTGQCIGPNNTIFNPSGPGTCPYITTVGATQLPVNGTIFSDEVAAQAIFGNGAPFTSGGGFSNIFPAPDYQQWAIQSYFNDNDPGYPYYETTDAADVGTNGGIYNRIGRGFPDISAVGLWWLDFNQGKQGGWGGTSMSAPIAASIFNRIVEERIRFGKGPIGFINPALYAFPELLFHDIVGGNNVGCGTNGFKAAPGWDPVTGLGTPDFPAMLAFFLALP
ncbi:hypothetical protein ANO11243_041930 [Dothideomycetidae sp. 11243]|nr:hypothetical protein ANO11243_041930 [fungal sp. No.11243]